MIESFQRKPGAVLPPGVKPAEAIETWLESTDDNPGFVEVVRTTLESIEPVGSLHLSIAPSLQVTAERERNRYLAATDVDWDEDERRTLLERMAQSGCNIAAVNVGQTFRHVRVAHLEAGEVLVEAGEPAAMVCVPLGGGLKVKPLGGYTSFSVRAVVRGWQGTTAVN